MSDRGRATHWVSIPVSGPGGPVEPNSSAESRITCLKEWKNYQTRGSGRDRLPGAPVGLDKGQQRVGFRCREGRVPGIHRRLWRLCARPAAKGDCGAGRWLYPRCSQILPVDFPGPSGDSPCLIWGLQITPDPRKHFLTQKVCLQLDDERDAECLG